MVLSVFDGSFYTFVSIKTIAIIYIIQFYILNLNYNFFENSFIHFKSQGYVFDASYTAEAFFDHCLSAFKLRLSKIYVHIR